MPWVEMTRKSGSGLPVVRSIKTPFMSGPVYFSTTGKAQVTTAIHDHLIDSFAEIITTDSTNPGDPIEEGQTIGGDVVYSPPDGDIDANKIIAASANIDEVVTDACASSVLTTALEVVSSAAVTIPINEHQQVTIPADRQFDVNGQLDVDGSFIVFGI